MKHLWEWIEDWLTLAALCAFAGFLSCVNHTPVNQMTVRQFAIHIAAAVLIGIVAVLVLDGMDWTEKQKLGAAVLAGYISMPLLNGLHRLARGFEKDPEKWIKK